MAVDRERRALLGVLLGSAGLTLVGARGVAQSLDPGKLLDSLKLPRELQALIPAKAFDAARAIALLIDIERDAQAAGLPKSRLALEDEPLAPQLSGDSFYTSAFPRLVDVIDRSEATDPALSDRAGALLAEVNASQHVVPEALQPPTVTKPVTPARVRDFATLKPEYVAFFESVAPRPDRSRLALWYANAVETFRPRYEPVAEATGVPWYFVGAIHALEASFNFRAHLHNGDFPLSRRTQQVPAGRPRVWLPPSDWAASARDALTMMGFAGEKDWSLARTLYRLEAYNGFGYRRMGVPTPYLWGLSTHYERGKFVADGRWNPDARSQQCGAGLLIRTLADRGAIKDLA